MTPNRSVLLIGANQGDVSACTGMLSRLGWFHPPAGAAGASPGTPAYLQSAKASALAQLSLDSAGLALDGWKTLTADSLPPAARDTAMTEARALLDQGLQSAQVLGLSDPQVLRVLPLWLRALPGEGKHQALVMVHALPGPGALAQARWLHATLAIERAGRGAPRAHVSRTALTQDMPASLARLAAALDANLLSPPEIAAPSLSGLFSDPAAPDMATEPGAMAPVMARVASVFETWAATGETAQDYPFLDQARRVISVLSDTLPDTASGAEELLNSLEYVGAAAGSSPTTVPSKLSKAELRARVETLQRAGFAMQSQLGLGETSASQGPSHLRSNTRDRIETRDRELAQFASLLKAAEHDANKNDTLLAQLEIENRRLANQLKAHADESDTLGKQLDKVHIDLADARRQHATQAEEIDALHRLVARVESERQAMASSTIWRATAPFRTLLNRLRGRRG